MDNINNFSLKVNLDPSILEIIKKEKERKRKLILIALSIISIISLILIIVLVVELTKNKNKNNENWLPILKETSKWNVIHYTYGKENIQKIDDYSIKVLYPKNSFKDSGGFKFYSQPKSFPKISTCFSYNIIFENNFNFVLGGKLPGLWIGEMGANGGNNKDDSASVRIMWRANGSSEVYLYLPLDTAQTGEFYKELKFNNEYGYSLWKNDFGIFNISQINTIKICIKVNSFTDGKRNFDGVIKININNIEKEYNKIVWTTNENHKISGLLMNSFFGGSNSTWATPNDAYITFSNFEVSKF